VNTQSLPGSTFITRALEAAGALLQPAGASGQRLDGWLSQFSETSLDNPEARRCEHEMLLGATVRI
jgi:hypothetical protein